MNILIVDDHAVSRRGLKEILEDEFESIRVGQADNAAKALGQIIKQEWDLVILDISLPGRSGLQAIKDIHYAQPGLPVLFLSMHSEDQFGLRCIKAGAAGYMTKESAPEELVLAIKKILAGGKYVSPHLAEKLASALQRDTDSPLHEILSNREFQLLRMLGAGKTVSQVAEAMSLSVKTISTYRTRLLQKLGMKTTAELIHYAIQNELTQN